ncbi:Signal recognition particle protein Ffh, partial [hydrothermal vent metagenome]
VQIANRAMTAARQGGFDVVILDTAGRTSIDEELMTEAAAIANVAKPTETLLVADALTGQDAVETATRFHQRLPLTGLVLTRMDGDGRGGAALSMRAVTGLPIKFLGVSEKIDGLDIFDAARIAGRILGRGDVLSLVEKAGDLIDKKQADKLAAKMKKGVFDLEDLAGQLKQMQKMGGLQAIMGMMPGMGKMQKQMNNSAMDDSVFTKQMAIISSMTPLERAKPVLIKASRKKRIAAGSGTQVQAVNQLLKMHKQMSGMMKKMGKGGRGMFGGMGGGMPPGAQLPGADIDPVQLEQMQQKLGSGGLPGLPGGGGSLPGLPGKK